MKVLVTGSSGLIGSALVPALESQGHQVLCARRPGQETSSQGPLWEPLRGLARPDLLGELGAVIHLAGANIAQKRWTNSVKRRLFESRVLPTRRLAEQVAARRSPPRFLSASAVGLYGERGDTPLAEQAQGGHGFLADLCRHWEEATVPALEGGSRAVLLRFGLVLAREGGALKRMLPPFRLGLGGPLGSGTQYVSWITREDAVGAILHLLQQEHVQGPVNMVAPNPVTAATLSRTLGRVLGRPARLPLPAWLLRLLFGEMAGPLFLTSTRAVPALLESTHYPFKQPDLETALRAILDS